MENVKLTGYCPADCGTKVVVTLSADNMGHGAFAASARIDPAHVCSGPRPALRDREGRIWEHEGDGSYAYEPPKSENSPSTILNLGDLRRLWGPLEPVTERAS